MDVDILKQNKKHVYTKIIITFGLFSSFFLCSFEISALITGTLKNQATALTPWYIKIIKDIVFFLVVLIFFIQGIFSGKVLKSSIICSFLWLFAFLPNVFLSYATTPFNFIAASIRWGLPMLLPAFLFNKLDNAFMKKTTKYILILFCMHFIVQVYQFFYLGSWFGVNRWGFASRLPGIFFIPNTAAFFVIIVIMYTITFFSIKLTNPLFCLFFISIFFTASGTGLIVFCVILLFCLMSKSVILRKYYNLLFYIILPFLIVCCLLNTEYILPSRGENYLAISLGTRFSIFLNALKSGLFSNSMGIATNTGVLLANTMNMNVKTIIVDNLYSSILLNLGYWGVGCFVLIAFLYSIPIFKCKNKTTKIYALFLTVVFIFSFTTITFEVFPVNLLIVMYISYFYSYNHSCPK